MFDFLKNDNNDKFTKRDFILSCIVFILAIGIYSIILILLDKGKCAYTGYTLEKDTKRPIFSECLIKMKDGSYVPLERYYNRVISINDLTTEN